MPPKKATSSRGKQKASETTDDEGKLSLNCLIRGKTSAILIPVHQNTLVSHLRELIYAKQARSFKRSFFSDIVAEDLDLYMAELDPETLSFGLSDVTLDVIPQARTLSNASQTLSHFWSEQPSLQLIHVFVDSQEINAPVHSTSGFQNLERSNSALVQGYQDMFITVKKLGSWTYDDIPSNSVQETDQVPSFVEDYELMLGVKRRVPSNLRSFAQHMLKDAFNVYCNGSNPPSSHSGATNVMNLNEITETELVHLVNVLCVQPSNCWLRRDHPRPFKEPDAAWLWFYSFSSSYKAREAKGRRTTVKVGEGWPFATIIKNSQGEYRSYKPKSDFSALGSSLPRLIIEVNSTPANQPPEDCFRMLLQAATLVRFANRCLEKYRTNKSCIIMAAYIGYNGEVERYLLFQDGQNDHDVYYKMKTFQLSEQVDRIRFTLELYNFFSALDKEGYDEDTFIKISSYRQSLATYRDKYDLQPLTDHGTKPPHTNRRNNRDSDNRGTGSGGGAAEQLESHGYVLMPDYFEDKGGRMEPLIKLPPHIYTVYRSTDTNQTELVAKHVDEQSTELEILDYLHTMQPQSAHIITLDDTVPTNTGKWAIFPKMHSIHCYLAMGSDERLLRCGRLSQLGWDLIDGLAFLHKHGVAHLDIKPGNLVYTDDFRLKIIDFDSAVRVESENDTVEGGDYGTPGWRAPEIQDGRAFSPIRADRWSCGKVLLCFVEKGRMVNTDLERFAEQLMDDNPLHRPSLVDWSARLDATLCDDDDEDNVEVEEGGHEEPKAQVKSVLRTVGGPENPAKRRRVLDVGQNVGEYQESVL